jgi:heme/copper-type cytochrome/quinol oxidase subunit 2
MVRVAALAVVGGVLGGCGREPATGAAAADSPAPSSSTTVGGLVSASPTPVRPTTRMIVIRVRGGQASGDTGRVTVPRDTPVTLSVDSDVADEIHVHGYDRKADIPAGGTASVSFTANISGVFEVELHKSELLLLQLQVS